MNTFRSAAIILVLIQTTSIDAAVVPLVSANPAEDAWFVEPANNKTWGYQFDVLETVTVTHLAWNDTGGDGLSHSHPVGIWKDTIGNGHPTSLLATTTIPAGMAAELVGPWRRVPIAPLVLEPGLYSIGGQNNVLSNDDMVYIGDPDPSLVDPRVVIGSFDFNINGPDGFHPPGTAPSGWYLFWGLELGPMLFLESIPEPSTATLTLTMFGIFGYWRRRFT